MIITEEINIVAIITTSYRPNSLKIIMYSIMRNLAKKLFVGGNPAKPKKPTDITIDKERLLLEKPLKFLNSRVLLLIVNATATMQQNAIK